MVHLPVSAVRVFREILKRALSAAESEAIKQDIRAGKKAATTNDTIEIVVDKIRSDVTMHNSHKALELLLQPSEKLAKSFSSRLF